MLLGLLELLGLLGLSNACKTARAIRWTREASDRPQLADQK